MRIRMSSNSGSVEKQTDFIYVQEEFSSGEDPPMSEWSSLIIEQPSDNKKKNLYSQELYSPGSGEICGKYIAMSDSSILRHPYYNYPAVLDPGIEKALLQPEPPTIYGDNGQDLYLALCKEMDTHPIKMFHRGLVTEEINLSYYGVKAQAVRTMAMALKFNKSVRSLNLTDNFLSDDACYHLGHMLTSNVTIQELNLSGCKIGPSGILRLIDTLNVNRTLMSLNVSNNNIGEDGGIYVAKQILNGAVVRRFDLSKNSLARNTALALAEAFEVNNKTTHLDLSWNNLYQIPATVKMLITLANNSTVLQHLNLAWNSLEGERIGEVIRNIMLIPTLTHLNLSNNRLQGEAIDKITKSLIKAKKLDTLDLSYNPMSPADARTLLEKMQKPRVKLENLLMANVWVHTSFIALLKKVQNMKVRKNFKITYGGVLANWTIAGPDARDLLLRRADFLGNASKKHKTDVPIFFLALQKLYKQKPTSVKEVLDRASEKQVPVDEGLITEMANVFPGPKSAKTKFLNLDLLCEYIHRIWPEKHLPPTPPSEPEPEPVPTESEKSSKNTKVKKK